MTIKRNHNLYIIRVFNGSGDALVKLGYSSYLKIRLDAYEKHNPLTEVVHTFYRSDARFFEHVFHKTHKSAALNEWYDNDMINVIKHWAKKQVKELISKEELSKIENNLYNYYVKRHKRKFDLSNEIKSNGDSKIKEIVSIIKKNIKLYGVYWDDICYARERISFYVRENKTIHDYIRTYFVLNKAYLHSDAIDKLNDIYAIAGITKSAQAKDLSDFVKVKHTRRCSGRYVTRLSAFF